MSGKYRDSKNVPTEVIINRLDELAQAVTEGRASVDRTFVMRIPAEPDYCPDVVITTAARRLKAMKEYMQSRAVDHRRPLSHWDNFIKLNPDILEN